MALPSALWWPG
ncbi:trp operon leader peptide [Thermus thermophilus HB8]|uniref:trp operon leader peptide n=1 Tax=Thermus thermophilus (strain ATCC 27634 / DSM 579 / HB8) TaxID=300852 RepID=LPW_THET8|nr:RecName: Full=trp operon leader peptide [Thermus thermophilus HB8]pir/LFTWWE/ probable trpEG leader peptide - Thermus aquaticus [Thermus aquaticus]BAD71668.1 trp operon leader peptide [Thermus thermophilus HB8]CAA30565.1 unnamed protein product [Thermus thermophilus HB8]